MFKNRLIVVLSAIGLCLVVAGSQVQIAVADCDNAPSAIYATGCTNALIPVTGAAGDYIERHPEMLRPGNAIDLSDYYQRHPTYKIAKPADVTDYFLRHPEMLRTSSAVDLSDWFLRHSLAH